MRAVLITPLSISIFIYSFVLPGCERTAEAEVSQAVHGLSSTDPNDPELPLGVCTGEEVACGAAPPEGCVDLSASTKHCGACGRQCFSNQECTEGKCTGVGVITPQELSESLNDKDFLLINVRVPTDDVIPHTDASIHHSNLDQLKKVLGEDRLQRAVLYCGTATRVEVALDLLRDHGYENLSVLESGISGWRNAGYQTVPIASIQ